MAGDLEVLLVSNNNDDLSYDGAQFAANTTGINYSTHNGATIPTLAFLQNYDVVLLYENGLHSNGVALGNRMAEYVNAGGCLVLGTFYWQGRTNIGWGGLENIDPFIDGGSEYNNDTLGTVTAHPLTAGITSTTGYYHGGVTAKSGTAVVARWADGVPLIGFNEYMVAISHFPTHPSYISVSGDFYKMWENALKFQ